MNICAFVNPNTSLCERPRPGQNGEMELRKSFIHKKYVLRSFIQRTSYGERELARDMEAAIKDNDMHALLQSFSEGARPEYTIDNFGRSCLHLAVEMGQERLKNLSKFPN